jgi:hypothetical protein
MGPVHCALCGRVASEHELIRIRGLKGRVCRPGHGCDRTHPALAGMRQWLAGGAWVDADDDVLVDNPGRDQNRTLKVTDATTQVQSASMPSRPTST